MKKKLSVLTIFVLLCLITACSDTREQETSEELPEGALYVFYISDESGTLEKEAYIPEQTTTVQLVEELFERLKQQPTGLGNRTAIPDNVEILDYVLDGELLSLYFGEAYYQMDSITEVLCRAVIVRTMIQVEGIDGVEFMVNNQPLVDKTGHTIGLMTGDTFMENMGSEINSYQETELKLYFSNEKGNGLIMVKRKLLYNTNISMEKLIVEQLLKGIDAEESGNLAKASIPSNTKLLNLYVKDGVCYVSFDENFANQSVGVDEDVMVYSLVNSLTEIPTITKVQISINGVSNRMFKEKINLNTMFERNLEYIKE